MADQYCIYLRKSRADLEAEARGEGETLKRHKSILLQLSKKLGLDVTEIYSEIVSGESIADRPVVQQVLQEVEEGLWRGVLVMEVERLARGDTIDQGVVARAFALEGTLIVTPLKTYDPNNEYDQEYFEFGLFMSRREYKTINRRLQSGRIASVKEGNYIGNLPPYGYVKVKLEDGSLTLAHHSDQADIVRLIYQWYTVGAVDDDGQLKRLGTGAIAKKLNRMGIPSAKQSIWTVATINALLRNPVYTGKVKWGGRASVKKKTEKGIVKSRPRAKIEDIILVEGKHEAIIDQETFDLARKMLASKYHVPVPAGKIINPLAGLVRCAKCGRAMTYRPYNDRNIKPHIMCSNQMCTNKSSKFEHVEAAVLAWIKGWIAHHKSQWDVSEDRGAKDATQIKIKALGKMEEELNKLKKQKGSLHDLLEQGVYDMDTFLERSGVLSKRLDDQAASIAQLTQEIEQERQREAAQSDIVPKAENAIALYYETETMSGRNELLKTVIDHCVYNKEKHQREDDFTLEVYPKTLA
ncbi:recombinase [Paenibacillus sp. 598K]|uniref:recombinase family protein n=1 Tax=Paenibacillus sp. 598K TaxID=1117987 RepID=UPI000FFA1CE1|nr:recombinase family protein [Paenibacillus sp. 598K]GBF73095.1 recombinase [Paenibacillus sp. 598K]